MTFRPAILDQLDKVEDAVRMFDSHYDVRQLYSHVEGLFKSVPRPEDFDAADLRWQFAYLGAAWAQIVTSVDLTYQLGRGYRVHDESIAIAERLWERNVAHPIDEVFGKQVLIRWHDASAKLYYRTGDHTTARAFWDKCISMLERDDGQLTNDRLAFLYPDIKSSSLRNEYEEVRQTTLEKLDTGAATGGGASARDRMGTSPKDELIAKIRPIIVQTRQYFEDRYPKLLEFIERPDLAAASKSEWLAQLTIRDRERLRGLANLYQNSFMPREVERIAEFLEDRLRCMQALHEQARTEYGRLQRAAEPRVALEHYLTAATLWTRVRDQQHWRRGHFFARQNLANLQRDFVDKLLAWKPLGAQGSGIHDLTCLRELLTLVDALQSNSGDDGGDYSDIGDVDLHGWTVLFASDTLDKLKSRGNPSLAAEVAQLELRVIEEIQQMVRQHRTVIRVGVYKQAFAKYHRKLYQRILRHYFALAQGSSDALRKLAAWSEESSSRELLDIVANQRLRLPTAAVASPIVSRPVADSDAASFVDVDVDVDNDDDDGTLRRFRSADDDTRPKIRQALLDSEREFNEYAKRHPVTAAVISPDIADKAREFCVENKSVIIRFFQVNDQDYGAIVFHPDGSTETRLLRVEPHDGGGPSSSTPREYLIGDARENLIGDAMEQLKELLGPRSGNDFEDRLKIEAALPRIGRTAGRILETLAPEVLVNRGAAVSRVKYVIVMPVGNVWKIPFHAAIVEESLLCTRVPVMYAMSISALVEHGRHAGLTSPIHPGPIGICTSYAACDPKAPIFGRRLVARARGLGERVIVVGPCDDHRDGDLPQVTRTSIAALLDKNLATLYLGCHGEYYADDLERCCLMFHSDCTPDAAGVTTTLLTPEQLALIEGRHAIPIVILAACVSGQGVGLPGGEISGFYRALAGMGASTCLLSFWPILSTHVDSFAMRVCDAARRANLTPAQVYQQAIAETWRTAGAPARVTGQAIMQTCSLGLFL